MIKGGFEGDEAVMSLPVREVVGITYIFFEIGNLECIYL